MCFTSRVEHTLNLMEEQMPPKHEWGLSVLNLSDDMDENFENITVEVVDVY